MLHRGGWDSRYYTRAGSRNYKGGWETVAVRSIDSVDLNEDITYAA